MESPSGWETPKESADALGVGEELAVAEGLAEADVDEDADGTDFGTRTDEEQPVSSRAPARTPAVCGVNFQHNIP